MHFIDVKITCRGHYLPQYNCMTCAPHRSTKKHSDWSKWRSDDYHLSCLLNKQEWMDVWWTCVHVSCCTTCCIAVPPLEMMKSSERGRRMENKCAWNRSEWRKIKCVCVREIFGERKGARNRVQTKCAVMVFVPTAEHIVINTVPLTQVTIVWVVTWKLSVFVLQTDTHIYFMMALLQAASWELDTRLQDGVHSLQ